MMTLLFILAAFFVVAGWGTAEMNYRTERKKAEKLHRVNLLLKQKSEKLESVVEHTNHQYEELSTAYDYAKQRADKHSVLEAENNNLRAENATFNEAIKWIEKKTRSREYTNNALARVIKTHLEHAFPTDQRKEEQQIEESKETFQRIKNSMGNQ
jgi:hypothetical protein